MRGKEFQQDDYPASIDQENSISHPNHMKNATRPAAISAAILIFLLLSCSEKSSNDNQNGTLLPVNLLPASGEISGWDKGTGPGDFGEADDYNSLYALIDGAAEIYIQHGFEQGVKQNYYGSIGGTTSTLELLIYDQGSAANVTALFQEEQIVPNNLTVWQAGDEAYIEDTLPTYIVIYVRSEQFFIKVTVERGSDNIAALSIAQSFALAVVGEISP